MPLFESQKQRNDRLFLSVLEASLKSIKVWVAQEESTMAGDEAQYYYALYSAWILGGSAAASIAVGTSERLKEAWGKGDERKALALTELFTLPMISSWYRTISAEEKHSAEDRARACQIAVSNVCAFLDSDPKEAMEKFVVLDSQLNHDKDKLEDAEAEGVPLASYALLGAMAEYICHGLKLNLTGINFPVAHSHDLRERGVRHLGISDLAALPAALSAGIVGMYEHYKQAHRHT